MFFFRIIFVFVGNWIIGAVGLYKAFGIGLEGMLHCMFVFGSREEKVSGGGWDIDAIFVESFDCFSHL